MNIYNYFFNLSITLNTLLVYNVLIFYCKIIQILSALSLMTN